MNVAHGNRQIIHLQAPFKSLRICASQRRACRASLALRSEGAGKKTRLPKRGMDRRGAGLPRPRRRAPFWEACASGRANGAKLTFGRERPDESTGSEAEKEGQMTSIL